VGFVETAKKFLVGIIEKTKQLLSSLHPRKKAVILVAVVIVVTLLISSLVAMWLSNISDVRFPTIGTIRTFGLEAYWDAALTSEVKEIPWGQLYPGSAPNITLYLHSISNTPIGLQMTTSNWTFLDSMNDIVYGPASLTHYMSLTWDYTGLALIPDQVIQVMFTLHVEDTLEFIEYVIENDVQQFSFDINVRALEGSTR
jgi:hypothetical protein